jgi:hypothetical protein
VSFTDVFVFALPPVLRLLSDSIRDRDDSGFFASSRASDFSNFSDARIFACFLVGNFSLFTM